MRRRLTFLTRFTLATFAAAVVAAVVLALVLETLHHQAVERDEIAGAAARIDDELGAAFGERDRLAALRRVENDARLFPYVVGFRVYDGAGHAIWPSHGAPDRVAIAARVAHADGFVEIDEGAVRAVYSPLVVRGAAQPLLVAIDFSPGGLGAQFRGEHNGVIAATLAVILIIFGSLATLASGASAELERRRREAEQTLVGTLAVMADTIDYRDPYTAGHSKRVAAYSRALAVEMRLPAALVTTIEHSALLHDLGKIGIPDAVLFKPAALDASERAIIGRHPVIGASILREVPGMGAIAPCVLHHHERWDGRGYPEHLAAEAIPLGARVIAVADAFDAMTTDRPYRRALSVDAAVAELVAKAETQFDTRCVAAFVQLVQRAAVVPPAPHAEPHLAFGVRVALEAAAAEA